MARITAIADDLWLDTGPVLIVGMPLTSTMTVVRLGDGSVIVHSPVALTAERRASVEAIGRVAHLYAPNVFHHMHLGAWVEAFPAARVHAPPGLAKKRPDLRIDRVHGEGEAFDGVLDEIRIDGFRLEESVLVHRPSRTLIVADLVHNIGRPDHAWTKVYAGAMGFYDRVALSRMLRWAAFSDRAAARRSVDALLSRPFDGLVVGHGGPIARGANEALAAAYAWLPRAGG